MKNLLLLAFLFAATNTSFAQIDTTSLVESAKVYMDAFLNGEYETMAEKTHPNILSLSGGKDFVAKDLEVDRGTMESMGFKYVGGEVGVPTDIYEAGREALCFVPIHYMVELQGKKYKSETNILASSSSSGKIWKFVSLDRLDQASIKTFIPNYNTEMGWPELKPMESIDN